MWGTRLPFVASIVCLGVWISGPIPLYPIRVMNSVMSLGQSFESALDAAKLGADWAWAALYGEVAGPVMGFFRSRGVADPEEAAGDVFFELARDLIDFAGNEDSFRTLVFAIAYKRLLVENRYSNRRSRAVLADRVLSHLQADVEAMGVVAEIDVPENVRRAFEMLTPEQRDVLTLRIVAGLSVDQVGKVLNRGVKTVKDLQRRGVARVRVQMSQAAGLL